MFRNLIAAPQREAYEKLKKKLNERAFHIPAPLSAHATLKAVLRHERDVEALLRERDIFLWYREAGDPHTERQIGWTERLIDAGVADVRRLVTDLVLHRLRRLICCVRIQRTALRILYQPRPGQLPKISRSLWDDGLVGTGEFGSTVDNGDADDDG